MSVLPFRLRDLTHLSPEGYRRGTRRLSAIRAVVEHQMGVGTWPEDNPMLARVRAHFVVLTSGLVLQLHPITARLRFGSGHANPWCVTIEHQGNFPLSYRDGEPRYWKPDTYGRSILGAAQVDASRLLLTWLASQISDLQVGTHRQLSENKAGCCGPDLWREVGQWAVDALGVPEMPVAGGLSIPDDWRGSPRIALPPPVLAPPLEDAILLTPR